jgi:hypothetical protein
MPDNGWPWPQHHVQWFLVRCRKALGEHPQRERIALRYLAHLATGDEPIRDLAAWCRGQSLGRLRRRIEDADVLRLAEREAGMRKRRGDIIHLRTRPSWWDIRKS